MYMEVTVTEAQGETEGTRTSICWFTLHMDTVAGAWSG